jgi:hypothetical protein
MCSLVGRVSRRFIDVLPQFRLIGLIGGTEGSEGSPYSLLRSFLMLLRHHTSLYPTVCFLQQEMTHLKQVEVTL